MQYKITLIEGDGIGPSIVQAAVRVIESTGVEIQWDKQYAGEDVMVQTGTPLPEETLDSIRRNRVGFKGPLTTPVGKGFRSVNVQIRQILKLYANLRPALSFAGVPGAYENIDVVVVRENTEGLYSGVDYWVDEDQSAGISQNIITRKASERIVRFAFEYAKDKDRKKVTAIHKANILKCSSGLFLRVASEVAKDYPEIEFEDRIVDNMAMQLVKRPQEYDVLVTTNLFGDILSDLCAGLVGGLGLAPSGNIGDGIAVFEPVHGSAPKYKGKNKANPCSTILSGALMLDYLGEQEASKKILKAVASVIKKGEDVTYDLKQDRNDASAVGTQEIADAIVKEIRSTK
ncbi:MAG: isocitrate/isopropylmalate dehydrogenase family protein [Candidatus Omnitrophica bacterium]|nr:isocitrate/isopropylmalate dehydrogenase family protein [Candidatus Omnitrophota bacterium]MBU1047256.1 isocitrate/isopropylmalate dehydrogenase family protein [Candidatus Omnitrophota bacterium]MBU1889159.1 isocitrate/isopropylmalate dehydrogenase family protein [Candidatus Omnitrophota bacterium]